MSSVSVLRTNTKARTGRANKGSPVVSSRPFCRYPFRSVRAVPVLPLFSPFAAIPSGQSTLHLFHRFSPLLPLSLPVSSRYTCSIAFSPPFAAIPSGQFAPHLFYRFFSPFCRYPIRSVRVTPVPPLFLPLLPLSLPVSSRHTRSSAFSIASFILSQWDTEQAAKR